MGFGWFEFIHYEDLAQMKRGFAQLEPRIVTFRCMLPAFGCYARFTHYKMPCEGNWLTLGKAEPVPVILPALPCDFYLKDDEPGTEGHKG